MSQREEELELQALQRELDDAFETTRPRRDFEDELWLRMQDARPAGNRIRDALAGLLQGIREVPAVPAAAVAAVLVVAIGIGLIAYSGVGRGGSTSSVGLSNGGASRGATADLAAGNFGRLPSPVFNPGQSTSGVAAPNPVEFAGPVQYAWAGTLTLGFPTAPVYRYHEPSTNVADQFASGLGAALRDRPPGLLGSYTASSYTLTVRGTVQPPPSSPAYFIFSSASMPPVAAAGATQADLAAIFLAEHSLVPDWAYAVSVDSGGDPVRVRYARQFEVPGYGPAYLVDFSGNRYGIEVDLSGNRPVLASGLLPVNLESADYKIVSPSQAIMPHLAPPAVAGASPPTATMTEAELVYVLAPAGDHSFYEPAYLFTGKVQIGGVTYVKRLLAAAVDPSQRTAQQS